MSDYRNFADSIFSSEIWGNEGSIYLIIASVVLLVLIVVFLASFKWDKWEWAGGASLAGLVIYAAIVLIFFCFSPLFLQGFNQSVAEHNISEKYNASKIHAISYFNENTLYARYTDGPSSIDDEVKFVFENNNPEPFIFQDTGSAENFSKIKSAISKDQ